VTITREIQRALRGGVCRREPKRRARQMARWKSDRCIVPVKPGNAGGGKAATPSQLVNWGTGRTQGWRTGDISGARSRATKPGHVVVGSRMRERRKCGSERGQGTIDAVESVYSAAGPALSTPRRSAADPLPASRRNSGSNTMTAADRGPALLAQTKPAFFSVCAGFAAYPRG
jgi:hypothetical protein